MGDTVEFECESYENVEWEFEGDILPDNGIPYQIEKSLYYRLRLENLRINNTGHYTCLATFIGDRFENSGHLTVVGKLAKKHFFKFYYLK